MPFIINIPSVSFNFMQCWEAKKLNGVDFQLLKIDQQTASEHGNMTVCACAGVSDVTLGFAKTFLRNLW